MHAKRVALMDYEAEKEKKNDIAIKYVFAIMLFY